jgi:hypothetical protein
MDPSGVGSLSRGPSYHGIFRLEEDKDSSNEKNAQVQHETREEGSEPEEENNFPLLIPIESQGPPSQQGILPRHRSAMPVDGTHKPSLAHENPLFVQRSVTSCAVSSRPIDVPINRPSDVPPLELPPRDRKKSPIKDAALKDIRDATKGEKGTLPEGFAIGKGTHSRYAANLNRLSRDCTGVDFSPFTAESTTPPSPHPAPFTKPPKRSVSDQHGTRTQQVVRGIVGSNPFKVEPKANKNTIRVESARDLHRFQEENSPKEKGIVKQMSQEKGIAKQSSQEKGKELKASTSLEKSKDRRGFFEKLFTSKKEEKQPELKVEGKPEAKKFLKDLMGNFNHSLSAALLETIIEHQTNYGALLLSKNAVEGRSTEITEQTVKRIVFQQVSRSLPVDNNIILIEVLKVIRGKEGLIKEIIPIFKTLLAKLREKTKQETTKFAQNLENILTTMVEEHLEPNQLEIFLSKYEEGCKEGDIARIFHHALGRDRRARNEFLTALLFWSKPSNVTEITRQITPIIISASNQTISAFPELVLLTGKRDIFFWDEARFNQLGKEGKINSIANRELFRCLNVYFDRLDFEGVEVVSKVAGKNGYEHTQSYPIQLDNILGKTIQERAREYYSRFIKAIYEAGFDNKVTANDIQDFIKVISLFEHLDDNSEIIISLMVNKILSLFVDPIYDTPDNTIIKKIVKDFFLTPEPLSEIDTIKLLVKLIAKKYAKSDIEYSDIIQSFCLAFESYDKNAEAASIVAVKAHHKEFVRYLYSLLPHISEKYKTHTSEFNYSMSQIGIALIEKHTLPDEKVIQEQLRPLLGLLLKNGLKDYSVASEDKFIERLSLCTSITNEILFQSKFKPLVELLKETTFSCLSICEKNIIRPALKELYSAPTFANKAPHTYIRVVVYPKGKSHKTKHSARTNIAKSQILYTVAQRVILQAYPTETPNSTEPHLHYHKNSPLINIPIEWKVWRRINEENHEGRMSILLELFRRHHQSFRPIEFLASAYRFKYNDNKELPWIEIVLTKLKNLRDPLTVDSVPQTPS